MEEEAENSAIVFQHSIWYQRLFIPFLVLGSAAGAIGGLFLAGGSLWALTRDLPVWAHLPHGIAEAYFAYSFTSLFWALGAYMSLLMLIATVYQHFHFGRNTFVVTEEALICKTPRETIAVPWDSFESIEGQSNPALWRAHLAGTFRVRHLGGELFVDPHLSKPGLLLREIRQRVPDSVRLGADQRNKRRR